MTDEPEELEDEEEEGEAPAGQLGDWADKIEPEVQAAAETYDEAHKQHAKMKGELDTAKGDLIAAMEEHGCERCPVRNGEKVLKLGVNKKVTFEVPKKEDFSDDD